MMGPVQSDELAEVDLSEEEMDAMAAEGEAVEVTGPPRDAQALESGRL
jgi:hypothetical protein